MANEYYNYSNDFTPGSPVRSEEVDTEFTAIAAAFDKLNDPADINTGAGLGGTDTGTADNYVVNNGGSSTLTDLIIVTYVPDNTNTGPSVLSLNGGANVAIVRNDGTALQAGDLLAGVPVMLIYDATGTRWVIIGATGQQVSEQFRTGINTQTGTSYTLLATDENKLVLCSNASAISVTVPSDSSATIPIGYITHVHQEGAGQVTLVPDTGVTLLYATSLKTRTRYSSLSVMKTASNTFQVVGDQATS